MRFIIIGLLLILLGLQYKVWFGENSLPSWVKVEKKLKARKAANQKLEARNHALEVEVKELHSGEAALEERARYELGMVKEDETYYHFAN